MAFDPLWQARAEQQRRRQPKRYRRKKKKRRRESVIANENSSMVRSAAYSWLAAKLGKIEVHIAGLTVAECRQVVEICGAVDPETWEKKTDV